MPGGRHAMMIRRDPQMTAVVALTVAALAGVLAALVSQVDRPYPGFFFSADYRVFPVSPESRAAGFRYGDHIVAVDGASPLNQPAAGVGAARGGLDLLPGAVRLRADHPGAGALHAEPARPRRDHAPAHDHHRVGHARARGEALARAAATRHPDG